MKDTFLKFLGLLFLSFCLSGSASAQLVEVDLQGTLEEGNAILQPDELLDAELRGNGNESLIKQIGADNQIDLQQFQEGDAAINLANLIQSGNYNVIIVDQLGAGNIVKVKQKGDLNYMDLDMVNGNNNNLNILQKGQANRVIQDLINSDNIRVHFIQIGNNNEIIQELNGINSQNFKVIQQGNDMSIIIRRSSL